MMRASFLRSSFRVILALLNVIALAMLAVKLFKGSISNDDLMAIMVAVLAGNIVLALLLKKRDRKQSEGTVSLD